MRTMRPNFDLNPRHIRAGALGVIAVVVGITGISTVAATFRKTPADKIAISYGGGPIEGNHFQRIVQPGSTLTFNGLFDHWYEYPVTQRNYIVSMNADEGDRNVAD